MVFRRFFRRVVEKRRERPPKWVLEEGGINQIIWSALRLPQYTNLSRKNREEITRKLMNGLLGKDEHRTVYTAYDIGIDGTPILAKVLKEVKDESVRNTAAKALNVKSANLEKDKIRDAKIAIQIIQIYRDIIPQLESNTYATRYLNKALAEIINKFRDNKEVRREMISALSKMIVGDYRGKVGAIGALGAIGCQGNIEYYRIISYPKSGIVLEPEEVKAIIQPLVSAWDDVKVGSVAVEALGKMNREESTRVLAKALNHPLKDVRMKAVEALGFEASNSVRKTQISVLMDALKNNKDDEVRSEAAHVMGNIFYDLKSKDCERLLSPTLIPTLREALKYERPPIKMKIIRLLGVIGYKLGPKERKIVIPTLRETLKYEDHQVKKEALHRIGFIANALRPEERESVIPKLIDAVGNVLENAKDSTDKEYAAEAIALILHTVKLDEHKLIPKQIDSILNKELQYGSDIVKQRAGYALAIVMGLEEALPTIRKALNFKSDEETRNWAHYWEDYFTVKLDKYTKR